MEGLKRTVHSEAKLHQTLAKLGVTTQEVAGAESKVGGAADPPFVSETPPVTDIMF